MASITFELDPDQRFANRRVRVTCSDPDTMHIINLALCSYFSAWGSGPTNMGVNSENYCTYAFPTEMDIRQAGFYYPLPQGLLPMKPL